MPFSLIFLLSIGSQLMAMDGPIFDPETSPPTDESQSGSQGNGEGREFSEEMSQPFDPSPPSFNNSNFSSQVHSFGGPSDRTQPPEFFPVSRDAGSASSIINVEPPYMPTQSDVLRGLNLNASPGQMAYSIGRLNLDDLNETAASLQEARQAAYQKQVEYENMLLQMEAERQAEANGSIQLTPEQEKEWGAKIQKAKKALNEAQGKVNAQKQTSDELQQQINNANAQLNSVRTKLSNQTNVVSRRAPEYQVGETTAQLRSQSRALESKKGRLQVRANQIAKLEAKVKEAQNAYESILKQAGAQRKEQLEAVRQERLATTQQEFNSLQQVIGEKQFVYNKLLQEAQEQVAEIIANQNAERELLSQEAYKNAVNTNASREQEEQARIEAEEKVIAHAVQKAKEAAQSASTQREKQEQERIAAEEQAKLEQMRADWQEAQRRMQERKNTRVENFTKQWIKNVKEKVAQRRAIEEEAARLEQEKFAQEEAARIAQEEIERLQLEQKQIEQEAEEARLAAEKKAFEEELVRLEQERFAQEEAARMAQEQAARLQAQHIFAEKVQARLTAEIEQKEADIQQAIKSWAKRAREAVKQQGLEKEAEQARLAAEQAKLEAETEVVDLQEAEVMAEPPVVLTQLVALPKPVQEQAQVGSLISAADTQRTLVKSYLGVQTVFAQQAAAAQTITTNAILGGQAMPAQVAQLSASVQTLTAQGQQIAAEQQQAKKDIGTLQALNEEVVKKLDEEIARLKTGEQTGNIQENISQIKGYQQQLAAEQKQLAAYLETLEGQTSRNQKVIEFYENALEKIKQEQVADATLEKDIKVIPSQIKEGQTAHEQYQTESEKENEEDVSEAFEDQEEEKGCGDNIEKVMDLALELKAILNEIKELKEILAGDVQQLDVEIKKVVEEILGSKLKETVYSSEDILQLVQIGKKYASNGQVFTALEQKNAETPFNKNSVYLARLDKELNIIQGEIAELQKDDPQTSDKPICQTLARMLNQLAKQVENAQKALKDLRKRNALNLLLIQST